MIGKKNELTLREVPSKLGLGLEWEERRFAFLQWPSNHQYLPNNTQIKVKLIGKKSKKIAENSVVPYNRPFYQKFSKPCTLFFCDQSENEEV